MNSDQQALDQSILDDLELHGGLQLTKEEYQNLSEYGTLLMPIERIKPYFDKLRDYLIATPVEQRSWSIARVQDISYPFIFGYLLMASNDQKS